MKSGNHHLTQGNASGRAANGASPQIDSDQPGMSCANWRFLPGLPATGSALIVGEALGADAVYQPINWVDSCPTETDAYLPQSFDLIAFPAAPPPPPQLPALRRWLKSTGGMFVGVPGLTGKSGKWSHVSPQRTIRQLRAAGWNRISLFGALPNPQQAVFFFPLVGNAMQFAFIHYFKGRAMGRILSKGSHPWMFSFFRWALPAYGIVAQI